MMEWSEKQSLVELAWIEELLPPEIEIIPKHGGFAYYLEGKLVMILVEKGSGHSEHKGIHYPFELWNGCILPILKSRQNAFFLKLPLLENHPANKNWLYIPAESENFEDDVKLFLREIAKRNPLLGLEVKLTGPKKIKDPSAPPRKPRPVGQAKADKKRENALITSMLTRRKKE